MDENNYTKDNRSSGKEANGYVDGTNFYLREIGKIPVLTAEEEVKLAKTMKFGTVKESKAARNKLISSNLRLVVSIAKTYARKYNEPLMEVIQEGNMGLMKAVEMFDFTLGNKFSTYATWWIEQKIRRWHVDLCKTIRLPLHMHEKVLKLKKVKAEYLASHHKEPSIEELAEIMGTSEKDVREVVYFSQDVISLETPITDDDDGARLMDFVPDNDTKNDSNNIVNRLVIEELLNKAAPTLTENENKVLRRRFGFEGRVETLEEISGSMGITRERVRQIEAKALCKIKKFIRLNSRYKEIV